ncbi:Phospholipase_D-nuclease N-terminal [Halorubrum aquaticum]|uniref:Phospholipase_D-nuclease N-terminal n=1 Tax=Halorubrum aquaticum TaxID=387340 RepID=A0A1I2YXC2_9EURY|nr:PLDc N-terminal domain-containing protein [Halorubrum aquaticum]SFH30254.1 Phospholipase_D-nuclease N-terminal [Halorubrum aquaticum]
MVPVVPLQGGIVAIVSLLFALLMFAAHIAMIVWTYSDAQKRSGHPAFLWAIVVFFAPLLGIVLYLILGRDGGY